jgi:hypothetical protein
MGDQRRSGPPNPVTPRISLQQTVDPKRLVTRRMCLRDGSSTWQSAERFRILNVLYEA